MAQAWVTARGRGKGVYISLSPFFPSLLLSPPSFLFLHVFLPHLPSPLYPALSTLSFLLHWKDAP